MGKFPGLKPRAESLNRFAVNSIGFWAEFLLRLPTSPAISDGSTLQRRLPTSPPNRQSIYDIEKLRWTGRRTFTNHQSRFLGAPGVLALPNLHINIVVLQNNGERLHRLYRWWR
jgi:hypothetical protein